VSTRGRPAIADRGTFRHHAAFRLTADMGVVTKKFVDGGEDS